MLAAFMCSREGAAVQRSVVALSAVFAGLEADA